MTTDPPCPRRDKWFRDFQRREKVRPIVDKALAASDARLRKALGLPVAGSDVTCGKVVDRGGAR